MIVLDPASMRMIRQAASSDSVDRIALAHCIWRAAAKRRERVMPVRILGSPDFAVGAPAGFRSMRVNVWTWVPLRLHFCAVGARGRVARFFRRGIGWYAPSNPSPDDMPFGLHFRSRLCPPVMSLHDGKRKRVFSFCGSQNWPWLPTGKFARHPLQTPQSPRTAD